ncbi:MAG: hypothetical protein AAB388_03120 [Patescibacteria group bacterium]
MFFIQDSNNLAEHIPTAQAPAGTDIFSVILSGFLNNEVTAAIVATPVLFTTISFIWSTYVVIAYVVSLILLILYVYASVQWNQYQALQSQMLRDSEKLYDEHFRGVRKNSRLNDVFTHSASENPNDWRLAIIEADIILDDILKQRGYAGTSLGERLRSISPHQLASLDDAWEAHKVRNQIAHGGADFVLTKRLAEETINRYRRVFTEFGVT